VVFLLPWGIDNSKREKKKGAEYFCVFEINLFAERVYKFSILGVSCSLEILPSPLQTRYYHHHLPG
jgi:hypothetical protein